MAEKPTKGRIFVDSVADVAPSEYLRDHMAEFAKEGKKLLFISGAGPEEQLLIDRYQQGIPGAKQRLHALLSVSENEVAGAHVALIEEATKHGIRVVSLNDHYVTGDEMPSVAHAVIEKTLEGKEGRGGYIALVNPEQVASYRKKGLQQYLPNATLTDFAIGGEPVQFKKPGATVIDIPASSNKKGMLEESPIYRQNALSFGDAEKYDQIIGALEKEHTDKHGHLKLNKKQLAALAEVSAVLGRKGDVNERLGDQFNLVQAMEKLRVVAPETNKVADDIMEQMQRQHVVSGRANSASKPVPPVEGGDGDTNLPDEIIKKQLEQLDKGLRDFLKKTPKPEQGSPTLPDAPSMPQKKLDDAHDLLNRNPPKKKGGLISI